MSLFIKPENRSRIHSKTRSPVLPREVYGQTKNVSQKGFLSEINTADPFYTIRHSMTGEKKAVFHKNLIFLLDHVFLYDAMKALSIDQQRFMSKFFNEADSVNKKLDSGDDNAYQNFDQVFRQLDQFLGSYFGEVDGFIR